MKVTVMEANRKVAFPWQKIWKVGGEKAENATAKPPISGKSGRFWAFLRQNSTPRAPKHLRDSELDVLGRKSAAGNCDDSPHRPTPAPDFPTSITRNM